MGHVFSSRSRGRSPRRTKPCRAAVPSPVADMPLPPRSSTADLQIADIEAHQDACSFATWGDCVAFAHPVRAADGNGAAIGMISVTRKEPGASPSGRAAPANLRRPGGDRRQQCAASQRAAGGAGAAEGGVGGSAGHFQIDLRPTTCVRPLVETVPVRGGGTAAYSYGAARSSRGTRRTGRAIG